MVAFYEGASIPWRESVPPPQYPTLNPNVMGNALSNLVGNYQRGQQGQQGKQLNDLALQNQKMRLGQANAFAGGVPMNPDGTPNYSAIMTTLAQKGDINAIGSLAPIIQEQQNLKGAFGPDPFLGGGGVSGTPGAAGGFMGALHEAESGNQNIFSKVDPDPSGPGTRSQGYDQINVPTWLEFAPRAGVDVNRYPTPMSAPEAVQDQVAKTIPLARFGSRTRKMLESQYGFGDDAKNLTVGQLAGRFDGGSKGTQVASLDPAASAYATPETPTAPPVSAAAGSTIPRANGNAPTAVQAVGGPTPAKANPLAANNPLWAGIDANLPVGQGMGFPALGATSSPAPGTPPNAALGGTAAFYAGLPKTTNANAPAQGSVASIASEAGIPPNVAANIAKVVGAAPDAPLTPQQELRAKSLIQNYARRTGQAAPQSPQAAQEQPSSSGLASSLPPLPRGFTDPQQAILALRQDAARLSRFGPAANGRIAFLNGWADSIAKDYAPREMRAGEMLIDPRTNQVITKAPYANANTMALQAFMEEHPNATAEEIQQFVSAGRGARSGVGMFMQAYKLEHPDATADEIAHAAQNFQSGGSALTKFTSGPQGNAIRSFNVLVDHLGTLSEAADALKNGNMRVANQVAQEIARQTGSAAPANFDAVKGIVGDELVKAIVGGGGALGDREEIKATIDRANSPAQLAGVIEKYKKLALGQLRGLRTQYSEATGRDDFDRFLAPGTRAFFGDEGKDNKQGNDNAAPSSSGLPPGWSVEVH